jgi:hypothetical protein
VVLAANLRLPGGALRRRTGETMSSPSRTSIILGIGLLMTSGFCAIWLLASRDAPHRTGSAESLVEPTPTTTIEATRARAEPALEAEVSPPSVEPTRADKPAPDREAANRMRTDIQRALARQPAVTSRPSDSAAPRPEGPVDVSELSEHNRKYLRERVQEDLLPPVVDCYSAALAADPKLSGTLALQFAVIGDPEIGGVVEYAEVIAEESTLISEFMAECVRESTLAMTFEAPPEGGRFELDYPLVFEPDDSE